MELSTTVSTLKVYAKLEKNIIKKLWISGAELAWFRMLLP